MCTNVYKCVPMCTNVYKCLKMCTNVYECVDSKYHFKGCKKLDTLIMLYMKSITNEDYELACKYFTNVEYSNEESPEWWQDSYEKADKYLDFLNQSTGLIPDLKSMDLGEKLQIK